MSKKELTQDTLQRVSKQFGSLQEEDSPMQAYAMFDVAWTILMKWDTDIKLVALSYLHVEKSVGIATVGTKGYTPTPVSFAEGTDGSEAVDWFNEHILGHTKEEAMKIVFSTMF